MSMNILDNIISWVNPKAGAERLAWREEIRRYDATEKGNSNWHAFNQAADVDDRWSRDIIRARARDLEANSDVAQALIFAKLRNITGKGFTLQVQTGDVELDNQIEMLWKEWTKKQHCDITGIQSFDEILEMTVKRKYVDGGMIIKKCYIHDAEICPLKLQCLEVDELDSFRYGMSVALENGNIAVGGIEFDRYHKPVAYYINQYDLDGNQSAVPKRVDARQIIFYYTKHRPSQIREISHMTATIPAVRDMNEFKTAVSVKERIQACLGVFIKKAIPQGGLGRSSVAGADGKEKYAGKTLVPGMIRELNAGDSIETVNPNGNGSEANEYLKMSYKMVTAGQGMSYESVSRDMSQSTYSSARQNIVEDEVTFNSEIKALKENVMSEIYTEFVISCVLCGTLDIPNFWQNKYKYLKHSWITGAKRWIDPTKEATANMVALQTGQKTFKEISNEYGKDWQQQIDDIAEVNEYAKAKGINIIDSKVNFENINEEANDESETEEETGGNGSQETGN